MLTDQSTGYNQLQLATDEFRFILPDMIKCMEYEDYLETTKGTNKPVSFRDFSMKNNMEKHSGSKGEVISYVQEKTTHLISLGSVVDDGITLLTVYPYFKHAWMSNRAMKAKMIKDATVAATAKGWS